MPATKIATTRILLVDDEPYLLRALERVFAKRGYAVRTNTSPVEALAMLDQDPADVVVSDEMMAEQRGTEFLATVAKRWPACVRVMLTGHADANVILRAVNDGHVHHFFLKPLPAEVLAAEIQRVIEYRALEEKSRQLLDLCREQARRIASAHEPADAKPQAVDLDAVKHADVEALLADMERRLAGPSARPS